MSIAPLSHLFRSFTFILLLAGCGGNESVTEFDPEVGEEVTEPQEPTFSLELKPSRQFVFSWPDEGPETTYRLLENPDGQSGYTVVATLSKGVTEYSHEVFLPQRVNARYILEACDDLGCSTSGTLNVTGTLTEAVGHLRPSNPARGDYFGGPISLSANGDTLAVGVPWKAGNATGINGEDTVSLGYGQSGAAYVFTREGGGNWVQQAYVKASYAHSQAWFGESVSLSADGNTLAVGARGDRSEATGINGDQTKTINPFESGAAYIFVRSEAHWSQQAHIKASDARAYARFGAAVSLSANGDTLAVGAIGERGDATQSDPLDGQVAQSGAVYIFIRDGDNWSQAAKIDALNEGVAEEFGREVQLSGDGNTLAVGVSRDSSAATGINGDHTDRSARYSGAAYVFVETEGEWINQAYLKASNAHPLDFFGSSLSISADGNTLVVGAHGESNNTTGINGDQTDRSLEASGAVYIFKRRDGDWTQQAYLKASNADKLQYFGAPVSLSADGKILAVSADGEDSEATGINGDQNNRRVLGSGAVYLFINDQGNWVQQAYIKAPYHGEDDSLSYPVSIGFGVFSGLSADGNTLAVGADWEDDRRGVVFLY